ncbi:helix-turn-helix transcriptional regulator [Pseudogemmobacter sp. W21_MBD1_M6]|uniref:helix-turn-helix transcriptional regulator n=1 Tax=Pseudogemmobacter sp. W21_MBD1_M6 TaxID=3240271 RepID=UPI003F9BB234
MAARPIRACPTSETMRRHEVAELLGVSVRTMEGWAQKGGGPAFRRIGRDALYLRSDVDAWFLEQPTLGGCDARRHG